MPTIEDFFLSTWKEATLNLFAKYDLQFNKLAEEHSNAVMDKIDSATLNLIDADLNTAFRKRETTRKILDILTDIKETK